MKEYLSVVTRKGQITVPVEVRRALGLKEGDKVAVSLPDAETPHASLRPVRSVAELTFGAVPPRRCPEDFAELRRLFEAEQGTDAVATPERPEMTEMTEG